MKVPEKKLLLEIFLMFFKIGMFTLGSGYAMIPIIENEIVEKKKFLSREEFIDILAVAQSCPGPFAVNTSIYSGIKIAGKKGGIVSALGAVLPSFIIILIIAIFFENIEKNPHIQGMFKGIKPATVALILLPVYNMSKAMKLNRKNIWIPAAVAGGIAVFKISAIIFILLGLVGGIFYYTRKEKWGGKL